MLVASTCPAHQCVLSMGVYSEKWTVHTHSEKRSQLRLVEFPYFRGAWYFPGCVIFSGYPNVHIPPSVIAVLGLDLTSVHYPST